MKVIQFLTFLTLLTFVNSLYANNLQITNLSVNPNGEEATFEVSWENSWYKQTNDAPGNWDVVWIFVKVQDCQSNDQGWHHALLSTNSVDHSAGGLLTVDAVNDGMGVFVRLANYGYGNISPTSVTVKFQNPYNVQDVNFNIIGIEMVAVLQGDFSIGGASGTASSNNNGSTYNYRYANNTVISSENAIAAGAIRTSNINNNQSYVGYNPAIPADFPKGYNQFYIMKYEIMQSQYAHFLNLLNFTQQATRTGFSPDSPIGTPALTSSGVNYRNSVQIKTPGDQGLSGTPPTPPVPAEYGCNLNNNNDFDEIDDGQNTACNFLDWRDLLAYLDWAALRPMTELEYEKACRGPENIVEGEYAWGNTDVNNAMSNALNFSGQPNEFSSLSTQGYAGLVAAGAPSSTAYGPLRVGFAATPTANRVRAGATYWGVMDMSGNVREMCFSTGHTNDNIAPFTGVLGDGELKFDGEADQTGWSLDGRYVIGRGGDYRTSSSGGVTTQHLRVDSRVYVTESTQYNTRNMYNGGRGVRQF